jgi:hypothetical protein
MLSDMATRRRLVLMLALAGCAIGALAYHLRPNRPFELPRRVAGGNPFIPPPSWTGVKTADLISPNQWEGAVAPQKGDELWQYSPPGPPTQLGATCLVRHGVVIDGYRFVLPDDPTPATPVPVPTTASAPSSR